MREKDSFFDDELAKYFGEKKSIILPEAWTIPRKSSLKKGNWSPIIKGKLPSGFFNEDLQEWFRIKQ
jgi:hypothetical protein